jgi:hypothetical protein
MKILVALVALVALAGIVAAEDFPDWKVTNKLSYSYQTVAVADEAGVSPSLSGATSGASFTAAPLLGASGYGSVSNTLVSGTFGAVASCDDPITQTLTQTGKANLIFEKIAEKEFNTYTMDANLFKAQEYDVQGQITNLAASFADRGIVGENYYGPFGGACSAPLESCGNAWAAETSTASGSVTPTANKGIWMDEAWAGTSSSTGITMSVLDDLTGCQVSDGPMLSGSSDAYAGFEGARVPYGDHGANAGSVTTTATVTTNHWLDYNGAI